MAAKGTVNLLVCDDVAPVVAVYLEFELAGRGRSLAIKIAFRVHGNANLQAGLAELPGSAWFHQTWNFVHITNRDP